MAQQRMEQAQKQGWFSRNFVDPYRVRRAGQGVASAYDLFQASQGIESRKALAAERAQRETERRTDLDRKDVETALDHQGRFTPDEAKASLGRMGIAPVSVPASGRGGLADALYGLGPQPDYNRLVGSQSVKLDFDTVFPKASPTQQREMIGLYQQGIRQYGGDEAAAKQFVMQNYGLPEQQPVAAPSYGAGVPGQIKRIMDERGVSEEEAIEWYNRINRATSPPEKVTPGETGKGVLSASEQKRYKEILDDPQFPKDNSYYARNQNRPNNPAEVREFIQQFGSTYGQAALQPKKPGFWSGVFGGKGNIPPTTSVAPPPAAGGVQGDSSAGRLQEAQRRAREGDEKAQQRLRALGYSW
jgi:hypothetical protein